MTSNEPNSKSPDTEKQLRQALRLACSLATALGLARGARARETRLAVRALDALQGVGEELERRRQRELHKVLEWRS